MAFEDVDAPVDTTESELLIVNVASDEPEGYDRGDVVIVRPHKWPWGRLEDPATREKAFNSGIAAADPPDKFIIIKINGRDFETARPIGRAQQKEEIKNGQPNVITLSKSRYQLGIDNLPVPVKDDLDKDGKASMSWQQFSNNLINKDN